jgi:hypothetical protein
VCKLVSFLGVFGNSGVFCEKLTLCFLKNFNLGVGVLGVFLDISCLEFARAAVNHTVVHVISWSLCTRRVRTFT